MKCAGAEALLVQSLGDKISGFEESIFSQHLATCEACSSLANSYKELQTLHGSARALAESQAEQMSAENILDNLESTQPDLFSRIFPPWAPAMASAAAALGLILYVDTKSPDLKVAPVLREQTAAVAQVDPTSDPRPQPFTESQQPGVIVQEPSDSPKPVTPATEVAQDSTSENRSSYVVHHLPEPKDTSGAGAPGLDILQRAPANPSSASLGNSRRTPTDGGGKIQTKPDPSKFRVLNNVINPDNGEITRIQITSSETLNVNILDRRGRLVRTLHAGLGTGSLELVWSGETESGTKAAPGIYVLVLEGPDWRQEEKLVISR